MLEKGKGPRIDKLRIIQLIQSDLQTVMKMLIQPTATKLEREGKINLCQFARAKSTTISVLVEKRLLMENSILTRKYSIWIVSDMTACYDRHICQLGELFLSSHRVNANGASMLVKNLQKMETNVVTAYGKSKDKYSSTEDMSQYGTGQGNIVSVFVCQFGTIIIFCLLEEEFQGWDVCNEKGEVIGCRLAIGFVDDTDFFVYRVDRTIAEAAKIY